MSNPSSPVISHDSTASRHANVIIADSKFRLVAIGVSDITCNLIVVTLPTAVFGVWKRGAYTIKYEQGCPKMRTREITPRIKIRTKAIAALLKQVGNGLDNHPEAVESVLSAAMRCRPHIITDSRSIWRPPAASSRNTS